MSKLKIHFSVFVGLLVAAPAMAADVVVAPSGGHHTVLVIVALVQLIAVISLAGIFRRFGRNADRFARLRDKGKPMTGVITLLMLAVGWPALAQEASEVPSYPTFLSDGTTVILLGLNALLLFAVVYLAALLRKTVNGVLPDTADEPTVMTPQGSVVAQQTADTADDKGSAFFKSLTDAVPVDQEDEVMLDHEYDGIRELDNNLPPWWVWMFWATIIFSVVYLAWYHLLPYGMSQTEEYHAELKRAEADKAAYLATQEKPVDENTVEMLTDPAALQAGKDIYVANCQACHAPDGGGGVGPNLTDEYWLHGGSINDIFSVIKYGVPQKGMISWESQLRPEEIAQVASYIKNFQGTTPLDPKEPQGEIWEPQSEEEPPVDASDEESEAERESNEKATAALP